MASQLLRSFKTRQHCRSDAYYYQVGALLNYLALAYRQLMQLGLQFTTSSPASRVADSDGMLRPCGSVQQVLKIALVPWCTDNHVRHQAEIGQIEYTLMSLAVVTYDAGTVYGEDDGQVREADIV